MRPYFAKIVFLNDFPFYKIYFKTCFKRILQIAYTMCVSSRTRKKKEFNVQLIIISNGKINNLKYIFFHKELRSCIHLKFKIHFKILKYQIAHTFSCRNLLIFVNISIEVRNLKLIRLVQLNTFLLLYSVYFPA